MALQNAKPTLESLESRNLLAGDVQVAAHASDSRDVEIVGDNFSNQIVIEEISNDRIRVTGIDGTTINGSSTPTEISLRDDLRIAMLGGADEVVMEGLSLKNASHNDLVIDLGSGDDQLDLLATDVARHLTIRAGSGADTIYSSVSSAQNLNFEGGSGHDNLEFVDAKLSGNATLTGGLDNDTLRLIGVTVKGTLTGEGNSGKDVLYLENGLYAGNVVLNGNDGGDALSLKHGTFQSDVRLYGGTDVDSLFVVGVDVSNYLRLDGDGGADKISVLASKTEDLSAYGDDGNDRVHLNSNEVEGFLYVTLGSGDDTLSMWDNVAGRVYFHGGVGNDEWDALGSNWYWLFGGTTFSF